MAQTTKKTETEAKEPAPLDLLDVEVEMLRDAARLNAGSKAASIHQKQLYAALKELAERRLKDKDLHQTGNVTWTVTQDGGNGGIAFSVPNNNNCVKCGHLNFSHPRLGYWHVCADFMCPSCKTLQYESSTSPGICLMCEMHNAGKEFIKKG